MMKIEYSNGKKAKTGYSVNMSLDGIYLNTNDEQDVGKSIQMQFSLPGSNVSIDLGGTIVWQRPPTKKKRSMLPGLGVRFTRIDRRTHELLKGFLEETGRSPDSTLFKANRLWQGAIEGQKNLYL